MTYADTEMGLVEVEQSDRDAAAEVVLLGRLSLKEMVANELRTGRGDDHPLVQAIAKTRIAEREACAKVCDEVAGVVDGEDIIGLAAGADVCAQSIRNRTGASHD